MTCRSPERETGRARGRAGAEANAQREGRSEGSAPRSALFTLVFPRAGLTQVSADMLGASPGVDYNIKTTRGRARAEPERAAIYGVICLFSYPAKQLLLLLLLRDEAASEHLECVVKI